MKRIDILLFDDFTALDAFGPAEVLGGLEDCALRFVSLAGGEVGNHLGLRVMTEKLDPKEPRFILLVPGGFGTRPGSGDPELLGLIREAAASSEYLHGLRAARGRGAARRPPRDLEQDRL